MALDPWIARGAQQVGGDIPGIMFEREQAERRNALAVLAQQNVAADNALSREQFEFTRGRATASDQQAQAQAEAKRRLLQAQEVLAAPSPKAIATQLFPELVQGLGDQWAAATDDDVRNLFDMEVRKARVGAGVETPKAPVPFEQSDEYKKLTLQQRQALELEGRRSASAISLERERARLRPAGDGPAATVDPNPFKLNDRQLAGARSEMEALINYAASYTGRKPEDVRQILQTQGPEAVGKLIEASPRGTDGRVARLASELPLLGAVARPILNTIHADLMQPLGQGGSGIAAQQNPTGPIANADVEIGKSQFPSYTYPADVQANIVSQRLKYLSTALGAPASTAPAPTATNNDPLGIR